MQWNASVYFFFETLKNSKYDQMWLELSTRDWILKRKHLQVTECEQDTAGHYPLTCSGGQFIKNIWQIKHDPQQSSQCAMACRDIAKEWLRFLGGGPEDVANTNGAVRRHPPTLSVFPHFRWKAAAVVKNWGLGFLYSTSLPLYRSSVSLFPLWQDQTEERGYYWGC